MNPEWLCYVEGQEYGPYTWPQLVQMAAGGNIIPTSYVRRHHDSQWYTADQVPGLFSPAAPVNPKNAAHPPGAPTASPLASGAMKKVSTKTAQRAAAPQAPTSQPQAILPGDTSAATLTPPAGIPGLAPAPAAIPRGKVASKTAPQPAAQQATPAAAGKPAWIPVVKDAPAQATASAPVQFAPADKSQTDAAPGKKPDKSKAMVLYLGGAIAGVALIGIIAIVWKMNQKPVEKEVAKVTPVEIPQTEVDPSTIAEANPTDANTAAAPSSAPATSTSATKQGTAPAATNGPEKPTAAQNDAAALLVKSIKQWKPIEGITKVGVRDGLVCGKIDAWLAADATGRRVNVKLQSGPPAESEVQASVTPGTDKPAEGTPAIAAPVNPAGGTQFVAAEAAPYLFVQVTITNEDKVKPRPYAGWNVGETAAVLADGAGKPLKLVAASATPGVTRVGAKEFLPGETIVDTLVFEIAPAGELLYRLALPKPAFSAKQSGAWGYEITGAGLATLAAGPQNGGNQPAVNNAANPAPAPAPMVAIPIPGVQEAPKPAPAPEPAPEVKKPAFNPNGPIPIPGLTDAPAENKPAGPKKPEEVPNANAPPKKK